MKYIFASLLLLVYGAASCQSIQKIVFDPADSTNGYYLAQRPQSGKIQGVLVLFPGFGQQAETIFPESKIHNVAYANDILTIAIGNGPKIYLDNVALRRLTNVLKHIRNNFGINADKFILGGYSAGGTIALRYTELCYETPGDFPIQPAGVFSVDAPVDLIDLYHYFERELKRNFSDAGMNEAKFIMSMMHKDLGELKDAYTNYVRHSPYTLDLENGNERFLKNVAVRVYHDVDVEWKLKNRRRSMRDSNELQASEMINVLLQMGNLRAEFISGKPGYRSSGLRHPHSWSIVDEVELVQWIKKTLEFIN